jgi:hypothetical protein
MRPTLYLSDSGGSREALVSLADTGVFPRQGT